MSVLMPISAALPPRFRPISDIAGSARNIEQQVVCSRVQPVQQCRFPQTMQATRHKVVHQVVAPGDGRKYIRTIDV